MDTLDLVDRLIDLLEASCALSTKNIVMLEQQLDGHDLWLWETE
jgi:hypothetical protein